MEHYKILSGRYSFLLRGRLPLIFYATVFTRISQWNITTLVYPYNNNKTIDTRDRCKLYGSIQCKILFYTAMKNGAEYRSNEITKIYAREKDKRRRNYVARRTVGDQHRDFRTRYPSNAFEDTRASIRALLFRSRTLFDSNSCRV